MEFSKKQKISIIISLWLFFAWLAVICFLLRTEYKGSLTDCVVAGSVGCLLALVLYVVVFLDKYKLPHNLNRQDCGLIKYKIRNLLIALIYVDIIGFFIMTLTTLLIAKDVDQSLKISWQGISVILTVLAMGTVTLIGYLKISSALRVAINTNEKDSEPSEENYVDDVQNVEKAQEEKLN